MMKKMRKMRKMRMMRMMRNDGRGSLKAPLHCLFSLLLVVSLLAPTAESAIGDEDGICNIFAFVPFTDGYVPFRSRV
jgi:hypothetical protein